jgi:hypothetical protein
VDAITSIIRTLHEQLHDELDCNESLDRSPEDHTTEVAIAGQILMDLRREGLTVYATRGRKPSIAGTSA